MNLGRCMLKTMTLDGFLSRCITITPANHIIREMHQRISCRFLFWFCVLLLVLLAVAHRGFLADSDGSASAILLCGSRPFWARTESGKADPSVFFTGGCHPLIHDLVETQTQTLHAQLHNLCCKKWLIQSDSADGSVQRKGSMFLHGTCVHGSMLRKGSRVSGTAAIMLRKGFFMERHVLISELQRSKSQAQLPSSLISLALLRVVSICVHRENGDTLVLSDDSKKWLWNYFDFL